MKIKRNAWHYRYLRYLYGEDFAPQTLCIYFWVLVLAIVFSPLLLLSCVISTKRLETSHDSTIFGYYKHSFVTRNILAGVFALYFMLSYLVGLAYVEEYNLESFWSIFAAGFIRFSLQFIIVLVCIAAIIGIFFLLFVYIPNKIKKMKGVEPKIDIISSYLKARKEKLCPTLEYESDES